ncbi:MAG TPA: hypothetical protein VIL81_05740, partial [Candidatus Limnocylindrales bacterium]
ALAAMADEPAPERLAARVAAIPNAEPVMQPIRSRLGVSTAGMGLGFVGIAGALVIGLAALVLRPTDHAPGGPDSSSIATVPSASAPSTAIPSTPTPSASQQSAGPPSASPSEPAPIGFAPMSVTFVSADEGWVLGSVACGSGRCPAIERTNDGGRTWATVPAPKAAVWSAVDASGATSGISSLRFATPNDGWAFGPDLWATHDGGASWTRISVQGLPSGSTLVALESARGSVHAVFAENQDFGVATSPVGRDAWTVSPLQIAVGAGPVPTIQFVLSGDTGWLLENDRLVVGGARLMGGAWQTWKPPCTDVGGPVSPAAIAASSPTDLVAACDLFGDANGPLGYHLFVSRDGGGSFVARGGRLPVDSISGVATPDTSTIVIAGWDSTEAVLVGSFDGGKTWSKVVRAGTVQLSDLGFTTPSQGVVITNSASGSGGLFMTRDGGHTWSAVKL